MIQVGGYPHYIFAREIVAAGADGASLGIAAMDLLRARLQGPPARRLGPFLHRAVLS
jgi:hypothetical protein